jgi:hypothetical protein
LSKGEGSLQHADILADDGNVNAFSLFESDETLSKSLRTMIDLFTERWRIDGNHRNGFGSICSSTADPSS